MDFENLTPETSVTLRWVLSATNPANWPHNDSFIVKVDNRLLGWSDGRAHLWTLPAGHPLMDLPAGKYTCHLTRNDGAVYANFAPYYLGLVYESVITAAFSEQQPFTHNSDKGFLFVARIDADKLAMTLIPFTHPYIRLGSTCLEVAGSTIDGGEGRAILRAGLGDDNQPNPFFELRQS